MATLQAVFAEKVREKIMKVKEHEQCNKQKEQEIEDEVLPLFIA